MSTEPSYESDKAVLHGGFLLEIHAVFSCRSSSIVPSFNFLSVLLYIWYAVGRTVYSRRIGEVVAISASKVLATGAKIEFCNHSPAVNPVFSQRTLEEIAPSAVMAGKGNNRIPLLYVSLLIRP